METKPNQEGATENVSSACDGGLCCPYCGAEAEVYQDTEDGYFWVEAGWGRHTDGCPATTEFAGPSGTAKEAMVAYIERMNHLREWIRQGATRL